ncbi:MAG: CHAT domain-containing protein [Verrucomicrobiales bacterium]|nr:CHAT domain-containing protein [Verrucomicrobiales bacterium]
MPSQDYLDFDLRVEPADDGYRAVIVNAPGGHGTHAFQIPFTSDKLQVYLLQIGQRRSGVRRAESPGSQAAREFGGKLFDAVFGGDVGERWHESLAEAHRQNRGLRLRLRLTDAPELAGLPWEYLYDPRDREFLQLSAGTPLVHYLELPERIQPLALRAPLRALVMVSSPSDYDALDVDHEWNQLQSALAPLVEQGMLVVDRLPSPTLSGLQSQLRRGQYHIFHFIGHGGFETSSPNPEGVLVVQDESGRGRKVSGRDLAIYLKDEDTLRLVVLNCCEGARTSPEDLFAGVAQTLVRRNIPAVIAMQFEISDEAAVVFATEFYRALADGWPVDASLAEARKAVYGGGNLVEWGTPVLYLRSPDGRIFDLEKTTTPLIQLVAEAEAALSREEFPTAIGKCEAALVLEPGHRAAADLLARTRSEQQLAQEYSDGMRHLDAGRWEQAATALQAVVQRRPQYRDAAEKLEKAKSRWRDNLVGPPPDPRGPRVPDHDPRPPRPVPPPAHRGIPIWLAAAGTAAVIVIVGAILWSRGPGTPPSDSASIRPPTAPDTSSQGPSASPKPAPTAPPSTWRVIAADGREHEATDAEIREWIRDRRLTGSTQVRPATSGTWTALRDIPELASHIPAPAEPPTRPSESASAAAASESDVGKGSTKQVSSTSETPAQPAGATFQPASPLQPVGYWEVTGWEQAPGSARQSIQGVLSFNVLGTFSMLFQFDGTRRTGEGTWTYFIGPSRLQVSYPNAVGGFVTESLQVTRRGDLFLLDGTSQGTTTHLELRATTMERVTREIQDSIREALDDGEEQP